MRLWEKVRNLTVSDSLILPWNAKVKGEASKNLLAEKNARDVFNAVGGVESLTAARTLTAADSGKTFVLNLAGGFTVDLPTPENGLRFEFIVGTAPSGGTYVIDANDNIVAVGVDELAASTVGPYSATATTITFADGTAVVGDRVRLVCDGTNWYGTGQTNADGGVTLA